MPTERYAVPARWRIEEPVYFGTSVGPARIVHRGDCRAVRDVSRPATTEQARTILTRPEAAGEEFEDGWDEDDERLGSPNDAGGAPAGDEQPSGPDAVPRPSPITTP